MKHLVSFLFLIIIVTTASYAQTQVSGGIYNNTTWTLANSPYLITGPIVVFPGRTLLIEPGVKVMVQADINPNTGASETYLEIRGSLIALGTANAPIVFTTDSINASPFTPVYTPYEQWKGIIVKSFQGGNINVDYFTIDHATYALSDDGFFSQDTLQLSNCTFSNNGLSVQMYRNLFVDNCTFINNNYALWGDPINALSATECTFINNRAVVPHYGGGFTLSKCSFFNNEEVIVGSSGGVIDSCTFSYNKLVVNNNATNFSFSNCQFANNQITIGYLGNGSVTNCTITNSLLGVGLGNGTTVENCEIKNNQVGIKVYGQFAPGQVIPNVKDNQICYNTLYNVENGTDINLGLEKNCFCESDSAIIEASIYDGYDDITRGLFNYAIYDSTCQNMLYYIQKVNLSPTSLDEIANPVSFNIAPNPAQNELRVTLASALVANASLSIFDMQGKLMYAQPITEPSVFVSLHSLSKGVYFLKIGNQVRKFVKA